jgi:transposase InsO family protein
MCGPLSVESAGGKSYFNAFYDDSSKYSEVRLVSHKHQVPKVVRARRSDVVGRWERQAGEKIRRGHTDSGTEYVNEQLSAVFREFGIVHEKTAPYSPEQNGAAERLNRTLLQSARAMLNDSGMQMPL